ncbi:MAG TPA: AMP-binding protein, partial [Cytophagales bacterium]|nr:AMP-binding protein [Cytophagales bacterium]
MKLYINGKFFSQEDISKPSASPLEVSVYEEAVLQFIRDWQSGQPYFTLFTSGSTGLPKRIEAPRAYLALSAQHTIDYLQLFPHFKSLVCLNTDFIAGKMMLVRSLILDMPTYVVAPHLNPFEVYSTAFDFAAVVPLQLERWLKNPIYIQKINEFKKIIVGGAKLNAKLKQACLSLQTDIYETYGMTETYSHIALRNLKSEVFYTVIYKDLQLDTDHRSCLKVKGALTQDQWLQTNDIVHIVNERQF